MTQVARPTSGYATASLILGIVGVFFGWCLLLIPNILAIIFGHIALSQIRRTGVAGYGRAVAGLATGYVFLALVITGGVIAIFSN